MRRRFDDGWARGFQIHDVDEHGYLLRRESDGAILPARFVDGDLRPDLA